MSGRWKVPSLSRASLLLFLLPAALGALQGLRRTRIRFRVALVLAFSVTALMVFLWSNGRLWVVDWSLVWPVWYMVSTAQHDGGEAERG
jgi:hypothetical protein